jgi:hypothetical protein
MSPATVKKLEELLTLIQDLSVCEDLIDDVSFEYVLDAFEDIDFMVNTMLDNVRPLEDKKICQS